MCFYYTRVSNIIIYYLCLPDRRHGKSQKSRVKFHAVLYFSDVHRHFAFHFDTKRTTYIIFCADDCVTLCPHHAMRCVYSQMKNKITPTSLPLHNM